MEQILVGRAPCCGGRGEIQRRCPPPTRVTWLVTHIKPLPMQLTLQYSVNRCGDIRLEGRSAWGLEYGVKGRKKRESWYTLATNASSLPKNKAAWGLVFTECTPYRPKSRSAAAWVRRFQVDTRGLKQTPGAGRAGPPQSGIWDRHDWPHAPRSPAHSTVPRSHGPHKLGTDLWRQT